MTLFYGNPFIRSNVIDFLAPCPTSIFLLENGFTEGVISLPPTSWRLRLHPPKVFTDRSRETQHK